ncbi:twin-arginine translocation signal domain-containing protein [Bradyrhizobium canariense]|uniref:twin-arginine translocation signal domain-containing protein n=2 Tax=Nitrobacteraceae TaxID=41294 RepID=UPI0012F4F610|nr:twin-arginine translocation signal domain-containing protein [Bradyrhizobium canariense]
MMDTPSRRAFLGFAQNAVAAVAIGAIGVRFIEAAEAMPIAHDLGRPSEQPDLPTQAQWGPPSRRRGWGRPRRRRWVCWWHRGRRRCGWRWR